MNTAWKSFLSSANLKIFGGVNCDLTVQSAIISVTGVNVLPLDRIPYSSSGTEEHLDDCWRRRAAEFSLITDDDDFLLVPPVSGGAGIGWVQVKSTRREFLPSHIFAVEGPRDFVAASLDGRRICAVSVEDEEYWIIGHEFHLR